jgi:neurofibromin 1
MYLASLEQETCQIFRDVAMRQDHQMRMPVVLEVGVTHLRVTSVSKMASALTFS